MDNRRRDLFARYVLESLGLSQFKEPGTAIIVRGTSIIATGFKQQLIEGEVYCTSAIIIALFEYILSKKMLYDALIPDILFCSYFPSLEEFKTLCYMTDIRKIYYMGEITDEEAVKFLNKQTKKDPQNGFEIIKLKI